jgi:hypothetical protein
MIKFIRQIRQQLVKENKFSKYLLYAIGEIILVVIGILIALQLNTSKENKKKSDVGYTYLTEMRKEVQDDVFMLESHIRGLDNNIKNQEAALNTNNIAKLPLDSLTMIILPRNLDLNISELTFNRMKNLGLTSLSNNDSLNSQINTYYNSELLSFKRSMAYIFEAFKKYWNYLSYEQNDIDVGAIYFKDHEFPSLYNQPKEALDSINRINCVKFITSVKGRTILLMDLSGKRYSLDVLNHFQKQSVSLLKSIYAELKLQNPQIEPLPILPLEIEI